MSEPTSGEGAAAAVIAFGFRPWVRSTCRTAMLWGIGVLAALAAVAWALRDPSEGVFGKAFAVLLGYALLFWASLLKIWWTAGKPAVEVDEEAVSYRSLQLFSPRRVPFSGIVACAPRPGTESLRVVHLQGGRERELFLNLAVVKDKHQLLDLLGRRLERVGLRRSEAGWSRPDHLAAEPHGE